MYRRCLPLAEPCHAQADGGHGHRVLVILLPSQLQRALGVALGGPEIARAQVQVGQLLHHLRLRVEPRRAALRRIHRRGAGRRHGLDAGGQPSRLRLGAVAGRALSGLFLDQGLGDLGGQLQRQAGSGLGQASGKQAQSLEYVLTYQGRFNKPEQYEKIVVRANRDGELLRLKDVATVELGSEFFDIYSNLDGNPSAAIVLKQTYGSNASEVIAARELTRYSSSAS